MLNWFWQRVQNQPVAFGVLVRLTLVTVMAFGVKITVEQMAAMMALVEALIGFLTWTAVTPNSKT